MRVGLNATCFNDRPSGANQRFLGLYGALIRRRPDTEFIVYEPVDCAVATWFADAPNVTARRTPIRSGSRRSALLHRHRWRRVLARDELDLFEVFNLPLVRAPDCPTILTVHDTRRLLARVNPFTRAVYGLVLSHAVANAARVITVSETMRRELLNFCSNARIVVIYNGLDARAFDQPRATGAMTALPEIAGPFLLTVGHFEPRKNYPVLLAALAGLRASGRSIRLVIVGKDNGERSFVDRRIADLGLTDQVVVLSNVDHQTLRALYEECRLVVFPSRYEGFGIPILEAMASRRPLVLSDIAVFREITQGQGAYFPPDDPAAMADAIDLVNRADDERARLVGYGDRRIGDFGFDTLAQQIERLYDAVLTDP